VPLAGLPPAERERFYREAIQPWKLRGYSDYLDRRTAWTDIEVLLRTAVAVVFPHRVPPPSLTELRQAAERESGPVLRPASARGLALLVRPLQFALDGAVLVCAFGLAYLLRFDFAIPPVQRDHATLQLPYVLGVEFAALLAAGIYRFVWRYVGFREGGAFLRAAVASAAVLMSLRLLLPPAFQPWRIPISVILMNTVLGFGGVLGVRVARRAAYEANKKQNESLALAASVPAPRPN